MKIETNNINHLTDFVRLNEIWIKEHFLLEEADRLLSDNPGKVIENGGFIFSTVRDGAVVGVCALFKDGSERFQLARMAVEPEWRGKGYGKALIDHAIKQAKLSGANSVYLLSNTVLGTAISLYEQFGFIVVSTGQHPVYARCNIVMERLL